MAQLNQFPINLETLKKSGLGAPIAVLMLMAMVVIPLPPFMLDIFFYF